MQRQQAQVLHLDPTPQGLVKVFDAEALAEQDERLLHAQIVVADALARGYLHRRPVRVFETLLGADGDLAEQPVVALEPVEDRLRDVFSL